jgi:hypothetical protein
MIQAHSESTVAMRVVLAIAERIIALRKNETKAPVAMRVVLAIAERIIAHTP